VTLPAPSRRRRATALGLAVVVGAVTGVLGAFVHQQVLVLGAALPVGLVLAPLIQIGGLRWARDLDGRTGPWICSAGWVVAVLVLSLPRLSGDIVIPATAVGYAFLAVGLAVAVAGPAVLALQRVGADADGSERDLPLDAASGLPIGGATDDGRGPVVRRRA
jgi:hypothetical protein